MGTITTTTVVDGKPTPKQYQLRYKGVEVRDNDVAQLILTRATIELVKVFKKKVENSLVIAIFKGKGILQDLEIESLEELDITSTKWAIEFLKLLGQRFNKSEALQLLCNLNHGGLQNYQLQIREAFQKGENEKLVTVVKIQGD